MGRPPRYASDETPVSRQIETATSIAELKISQSHQTEALARIETVLSEIRKTLGAQHDDLQSLLSTRRRTRAAIKWVAGVAATVVAALVLAWRGVGK